MGKGENVLALLDRSLRCPVTALVTFDLLGFGFVAVLSESNRQVNKCGWSFVKVLYPAVPLRFFYDTFESF